jgi:hypothetical protein
LKGSNLIDEKRWFKFTFSQQMGNIASEISRAIHFENRQDVNHLKSALLRTIELLDLTKEDTKNIKRLKELCRFKEVVCDWYCGTNVYNVDPKSLKNYAMIFALAAQR